MNPQKLALLYHESIAAALPPALFRLGASDPDATFAMPATLVFDYPTAAALVDYCADLLDDKVPTPLSATTELFS